MTTAKLDAAGHRWLADLALYDFSIVYRPGKQNQDGDGLSRRPQNPELEDWSSDVEHIDIPTVEAVCQSHLVETTWVEAFAHSAQAIPPEPSSFSTELCDTESWKQHQRNDPEICLVIQCLMENRKPSQQEKLDCPGLVKFVREWPRLKLFSGILYRLRHVNNEDQYKVVLPASQVETALQGLHNQNGHFGIERTLELAKERFFWPGMSPDVEAKVKHCEPCIRRKARPDVAPLVSIKTTQPLELVCMDYLTLEESVGGYSNILVITDHFTKYAQAYPTRNQSAKTTARILFDNFVVHYGFPARLHSDQGRNFESRIISQLCKIAGIKKSRTTPYHAMGNGVVERMNSSLLGMLRTLTTEQKTRWKDFVPALVHAYNSTKHDSTNFSPFYLMFGRQPRLPVDIMLGTPSPEESSANTTIYSRDLRKRLDFAYKLASEQTKKAADKYKKYYDISTRGAVLEVGDRVLVKAVSFKGKHKLANKWEDDVFVVLEKPNKDIPVYVVQRESKMGPKRTLHRNLLLPIGYLPRPAPRPAPRKRQQVQDPDNELQDEESETDSETEDLPQYWAQPLHQNENEDVQLNPLAPEFIPEYIPDEQVDISEAAEVLSSTSVENDALDVVAEVDEPVGEINEELGTDVEDLDSNGDEIAVQDQDEETMTNGLEPDPPDPPQPVPRRSTRNRTPNVRYNPAEWDVTHYQAACSPTGNQKAQLLLQLMQLCPEQREMLCAVAVNVIKCM